MAKNKENDQTPAEDYFAQLEWKRRFGRRRVFDEPNWRYKIIYPKRETDDFLSGVVRSLFIIGIFFIGFLLLNQAINYSSGLAIFILIVMLITGVIIGFAIKDLTNRGKKSKTIDDDDEIFNP